MNRRVFLQTGLAASMATPLCAALKSERLDAAAAILAKSVANGQVTAAVMHVVQREATFTRCFGSANENSRFLLGSISKPICVTALMTLYDRGHFQLDDPLKKFLPKFTGDGRDAVTIRHLLTHVSGLPDQLSDNNDLRKNHATLRQFVDRAVQTPLQFASGTRYQYSSMGILLAVHLAELISGGEIREFVNREVFRPLEMKRSALGLGTFALGDVVPEQIEFAAPEAGGGDPTAKDWDWNSAYWRKLGSPWGGVHASAPDLAKYLAEFLDARGAVVKPDTARLMVRNHNPAGLAPRGLGFDVGLSTNLPKVSKLAFGHTGSTGTLAWADPANQSIGIVLTSLPARAMNPHPRDLAAEEIAAAA